jgi:serine/threonine protein kinase
MDPSRSRPPAGKDDPAQRLWRLGQQGQRPDLRAFLAGAGPLTPAQLLACVRVDLQQRWQAGERVPAEAYFRDFPALQEDRESALVLVYGEFLLREQLGEAPAPEEYLRRFPQDAAALRMQFELHEALEEDDGSSCADGASVPSPAGLPEVPGYEILEVLGGGSTSVVYKAWQAGLRRLVALKVVRPDLRIGSQERARFRTEGEAVARVQHPNVVQIHDIGEWRGRPYLVLEYVEGGSLAARLTAGPLPLAEAVPLVEALARTMHHVHQRGILHRDLNPANVLLAADGTPKITDFGLAKLLVGGVGLTQTGAVLGTPGYMAPEQADGRTREVGPATDVHALGAILYHVLTGRPPYDEGALLPTLLKVRSPEMPPPVQKRRPDVPSALEAVCVRCLNKRPADRYPTALALAEHLARLTLPRAPLPTAPPARPAVPVVELVAATGERFPLSSAITVLGRSAECNIQLQEPKASRRHCRIVLDPGGMIVEDLGSARGTLLNDRRVQSAWLQDGDRLDLGGQVFQVRVRPPGNNPGAGRAQDRPG